MKYKKVGNTYLIRLEKGESVMKKLHEFCEKEGIRSGHFSGIGGLEWLEIAYYKIEDKKYHSKVFDRPPMELLSLKGNVSVHEGKTKIHAHVLVGDRKFKVFGGHLKDGVVLPTCEIVLTRFGEIVERKMDSETGLPLLDL
jgi:predicted DNA-binding protein with PD1-like motif